MTGVAIFRLIVNISTDSNMFATASNSKLKVRCQQEKSLFYALFVEQNGWN
jgi:hypothetical protein